MAVLPQRVKNWFEGLRFPVLVLLAGALFLVNVFIPDVLPFVDEALLALLAILLSRLKRRSTTWSSASAPTPPARPMPLRCASTRR